VTREDPAWFLQGYTQKLAAVPASAQAQQCDEVAGYNTQAQFSGHWFMCLPDAVD
jgi:hypothetical protein